MENIGSVRNIDISLTARVFPGYKHRKYCYFPDHTLFVIKYFLGNANGLYGFQETNGGIDYVSIYATSTRQSVYPRTIKLRC